MKIEIDTKDIIQRIVDDLDYYKLLEVLCEDIEKDNPDWWTKQVVKHIENDILKLMQTEEFMEYLCIYLIKNTDIEEDVRKEVVDNLTSNLECKLPKLRWEDEKKG